MADEDSFADSELELELGEFETVRKRKPRKNMEVALTMQLAQTPDQQDTFRPLLADAQKIGFFSLDRACQTTVTEIIELKELTDTVEQLLEDSAIMRRDIGFARSVMQAEFDAKLQFKALDLYARVNEKVAELERTHDERVGVVRRAFRQQLADALVRVKTYYNRNADLKLKRDLKRKDVDAEKWKQKFKELQATIQRNESVIHMLKLQLSQHQENEADDDDWLVEMDEAEMGSSTKSRSSNRTPSVNPAEEELEDAKGEIQKLYNQVDRLQDALDIKEKDNEDLTAEIKELKDQLERERIMIEQLQQEKTLMHEGQQAEQQSSQQFEETLEAQRIAMEKEMNERIRQAREETLANAKLEAAALQKGDVQIINSLQDEIRILQQLLAKEKAKQNERSKSQVQVTRAKVKEEVMGDEVSKLKREIDRIHRTWEKKFAILQQSLHALKDESYLRQTMQKQAAQLHQASISYAADIPIGIMPVKLGPPNKKPLPDISNRNQKPGSPPDYLSYTVSAPSGRATTLFSTDENQIMSDGEDDLPEDVVPLPPPPARNDDSRPSTRSHVVVVPSH